MYSTAKKLESVTDRNTDYNDRTSSNNNEDIDSYEDSNEFWEDYFMRKGRNKKTYRDKHSNQEHDQDDW